MNTPDGPVLGDHAPDELLAALAMDAGDEDVDGATRTHVETCDHCAAELDALRETVALVVAARDETFTAPPASVWDAVSREIEASSAPQAAPAPSSTDAVVTPLDSRRRVPTWLATTAAAVALAAGVGVGMQLAGGSDEDPAPAPQVLGTTALASLDDSPQDRGAAEVRRHDDRVVLHVEAADLGGPDGTREVWLINTDGTRMVSLGLLASGDAGEFEFPERLLEQGYRIVDISYEPDDGDPVHSGRSLARGTIDG